ncbi:hypothetical protein [Oligoflexus tunisiensis]|uniref:hypothetical protein n=1 Tax=Oligoflexus tunisiensis TaxID=708132 RepID=UPI00114D0297|nr:hypothetical protein [Oligoflexus tunisiensis]
MKLMRPGCSFALLLVSITLVQSCGKKPEYEGSYRGSTSVTKAAAEAPDVPKNMDSVPESPKFDFGSIRIKSDLYVAMDPLKLGPYQGYDTLEYALPAAADTNVMPDGTLVDVRGIAYLPKSNDPNEKFPTIIVFTGNHSGCGILPADPNDPRVDINNDFRLTGACPAGMIEAPSHKGYEYLANVLTSYGYAVISVNPNRGIQGINNFNSPIDPSYILARAALLRKHITYLKSGFARANSLDLQQLGLLGHSRGGDTMRAFYNTYKEPGEFQVRAIYELAPIDSGSGKSFDAPGVPWGVMIGACDGDVTAFQGIHPYRRMWAQKSSTSMISIVTLTGANHNYFNTEWQTTDARICEGDQQELWDYKAPLSTEGALYQATALKGVKGSARQRTVAQAFVTAFFRANVGIKKDPSLNRLLDSRYVLPKKLADMALIQREFLDFGTGLIVDEVSSEGSVGSDYNEYDIFTKGLVRSLTEVNWNSPNEQTWYQSNVWEQGKDLSQVASINIPIARREICDPVLAQENCGPSQAMDFSLQLVDVDGNLSMPFKAGQFAPLRNIVNRNTDPFNTYIPLLFDTISLPVQEMVGKLPDVNGKPFPLDQVMGVRFVFNQSKGGRLYVSKRWALEQSKTEYPAAQAASLALWTKESPNRITRSQPIQPAGVSPQDWARLKSASSVRR